MIVLDTHALIWWSASPHLLSKAARRAIDDAEAIGVSSISAWEIAMLVQKKRLELDRPVEDWVRQAFEQKKMVELPITADIGLYAGSFDDTFHGDPADRIIAATTLLNGSALVTKDQNLRSMPALRPIW